jgi:2-methylisocitrate lyase-like PEP mutase family enzyme
VVYVTPATELLARIVAARAAAVQVAAHAAGTDAMTAARAGLDAAISRLDATDHAVGGTLAVSSEWAAPR